MGRSLSLGLLFVAGCFADPPVVGGSSVGSASGSNDSSGSEASSASSAMTSGDDSAMTTSAMTSSAEITGDEPQTGGSTATSTGSGSGMPGESGSVGTCSCEFDSRSDRGMGGAYECLQETLHAKVPDLPCPPKVGSGAPCMTTDIGPGGCCTPDGSVLWCPDMEANTVVEAIDCSTTCPS